MPTTPPSRIEHDSEFISILPLENQSIEPEEPFLSIFIPGDAREGQPFTTFSAYLRQPPEQPVSFNYWVVTEPGSGRLSKKPENLPPQQGLFQPGQRRYDITVPLLDDEIATLPSWITIYYQWDMTTPEKIWSASALVYDNDGPVPQLSIDDLQFLENSSPQAQE